MHLIVGLGNPGSRYLCTRHNIGFQSVDKMASIYQISLSHTDLLSQWGRGEIKGKEVILAKPQTYMNLSGKSVAKLLAWFHLPVSDLIVIHDDLDLPLGRFRIREKGSSGGHRGLESIIEFLKVSGFIRLRLGIGRPKLPYQEPKEYVLEEFLKTEQPIVDKIIDVCAECVETILAEGVVKAMNRFNSINMIEN